MHCTLYLHCFIESRVLSSVPATTCAFLATRTAEGCASELEEVPDFVREGIEFYLVEHYDEVFAIAFPGEIERQTQHAGIM